MSSPTSLLRDRRGALSARRRADVSGQGNDNGLGSHKLGVEIIDERWTRYRGVETPGTNSRDQLRDREGLGLERNLRMALGEKPDDRRHGLVGQGSEKPHVQLDALSTDAPCHDLHRALRMPEDEHGLSEQHMPDGRERYPAVAAAQ